VTAPRVADVAVASEYGPLTDEAEAERAAGIVGGTPAASGAPQAASAPRYDHNTNDTAGREYHYASRGPEPLDERWTTRSTPGTRIPGENPAARTDTATYTPADTPGVVEGLKETLKTGETETPVTAGCAVVQHT